MKLRFYSDSFKTIQNAALKVFAFKRVSNFSKKAFFVNISGLEVRNGLPIKIFGMRQPKSVEFPKLRIAMLPENIFRTRVAWGGQKMGLLRKLK